MYFGDHPISRHWELHLEGQYRRTGIGQRWEQLLLRPGLQREFGHGLSALAGYTYQRNYPFEGGSLGPVATGPQPEHSSFQQFQLQHRIFGPKQNPVQLTHRFRLEQRWTGTARQGAGVVDWKFADRARYRLTANLPFRWTSTRYRPDYASVYNEVFVNFGPHGGTDALNLDRTYGALGWKLNGAFHLELGYLFQYSPKPNGITGEQDHAFQVTILSIAPFRRALHREKN